MPQGSCWAICGGFAGSQFSKPVVEHCLGFWVEMLPSWRGSPHVELANLPAKEVLGFPRSQGEGGILPSFIRGASPLPFVYHFDSTPFVYIQLKKHTFAYFHNVPVL